MKQENDYSSSEELRVYNGQATLITRHGGLYYNNISMKKTEKFLFSLPFFTREKINYFHQLAKRTLDASYFHGKMVKKIRLDPSLTLPLIKERELVLVQGNVIHQSWYNDPPWP